MNLRIDAVIEFLDAQRALGDSQLATEQLPEFRPGEVHSKVHRLVDGLRADAARDSRLHVPVDVLLPVVLSDPTMASNSGSSVQIDELMNF